MDTAGRRLRECVAGLTIQVHGLTPETVTDDQAMLHKFILENAQ